MYARERLTWLSPLALCLGVWINMCSRRSIHKTTNKTRSVCEFIRNNHAHKSFKVASCTLKHCKPLSRHCATHSHMRHEAQQITELHEISKV